MRQKSRCRPLGLSSGPPPRTQIARAVERRSPLSRHDSQAGVALITVVLVVALVMVLALSLTTSVVTDTNLRGAFARVTSGFYAAESGVNHGMGSFRNIFLDFRVPVGSDFLPHYLTIGNRNVTYRLAEIPGNPQRILIPAGQLFGGLSAIRYVYTVKSEAESKGETEAIVGAQFDVDYIPLFQFIAFYAGDLEIEPGPTMHLHGRVHTNGDLYLNSGDHLYIEDNQGAGVPANEAITTVEVSAKGAIYRGRKDTSACTGIVTIDALQDVVSPSPDLDPIDLDCGGGGRRQVPAAELAAWRGSLLGNTRDLAIPQPDVTAKGSGVFWTRADLRIVLRLNANGTLPGGPGLPHTIEVQAADGNPDGPKTAQLHAFMADQVWNQANSSLPGTMPIFYTAVPTGTGGCTCTNASATGCNNGALVCYDPPFSSNGRVYATVMGPALGTFDLDYRRGGFYNWREHKWMFLLNINLHDLLLWNQSNGAPLFDPADVSDGGLVIYASVEGPDSAGINNYGVRLFGSAGLPFPPSGGDPTGVTLVSDQAAYVAGDYNRGPLGGGGLPKQPAAVIADSLNLLSNNYFTADPTYTCGATVSNDCQSNRSLTDASRRGANTTMNTAFLAGVDNTTPGNYNGGLENYPRFHEDWGGFALAYRGSFVSLGTPAHVSGNWCETGGSSVSGCNIYNPPLRNWDYDPDFNDVKNIPPLTPRFVSVEQVLFSQDLR